MDPLYPSQCALPTRSNHGTGEDGSLLLVLSCDEKSQIQALDRTQPSLPFRRGKTKTITHDYKRNGTSTPFAALDAATGKVISMCAPRHRHQEWLNFLKRIDKEVPAHLTIHVIADNYSTHKHEKVRRWPLTLTESDSAR